MIHSPEAEKKAPQKRLVVGVTGASGAPLAIRLLQALKSTPIETHLVLSDMAKVTILQETVWSVSEVLSLADYSYAHQDVSAAIASGSFVTMGMVVIPCSVKTLSAIANSYTADLIARAADVTLKEGRRLILVFREAPLHPGHIRLMARAAENGAIIFPPVPAFYTHPARVEELVDQIVGRILMRMGIDNDLYHAWEGPHA